MSLNLSLANLTVAAALALAAGYSIFSTWRTQLPWARWRVGAMLVCRLMLLASVAVWCLELRLEYKSSSRMVELAVISDHSASISPQGQANAAQWVARAQEAMTKNSGLWVKTIVLGSGDQRSTPLAEALDAARVSLQGLGEKRILLLSDGRATTRDPLAAAERLHSENVRLFAVPLDGLPAESLIADLAVPPAAWRNVPLPVQVTLLSAEAQPCHLTLAVDDEIKEHRDAQLPGGTSSVEIPAVLQTDGIHRLEVKAEFQHDSLDWNNSASALVDVPLAPRVIIISEPSAAGAALASVLSGNGFETRVMEPKELPAQFSCDCIVLANVPASSLAEPRLKAIEQYVREGGAIVFTGGERAFGAGGYMGSALEPVFPVLLMPKKERPPFALAIVMDNSWSMNEGLTSSIGKINIAKEIAIAAMECLNRTDLLTFVSFDSDYHNIIQPTKVAELAPLEYEVARIGAFGMTNILGGMQEGARLLRTMDAPYRHLILISDGKETEVGTDYSRLLAALERDKVTLTAIGVGLGPNEKLLNTLAFACKGRYYHAKSIQEIPSAVLQEAKSLEDHLVVSIPLQPRKVEEDPALAGLDVAALPKLLGFNRSRARTHAWTPLLISSKNEPLLARMRYGRGQSLAFLSMAGAPWSKEWIETAKPEYTAFWWQAVTSVLSPPYRELEARAEYENGSPTFDLSRTALAGAANGDKCELTRLAGGKQTTVPAPPPTPSRSGEGAWGGPLQIAAASADALLLTAKGKANWAFSWSRTYGREFAEASHGVETLKELCRVTGGLFAPKGDEPFAPGKAVVTIAVAPAAWLVLAAVLLVVELLLRRGPALTALLRRKGRLS